MATIQARPVAARDHCLAPDRVVDAPIYGGRYGRMFPDLPPFEADEAFLQLIGSAGGACDASPSEAARDDDANVAAGWPFLGQLVAHDLTHDRSPLRSHSEAEALRNFRAPRLNLECLYGGGPVGSPYLFEWSDPAKLLLGPGGHDVPRNQEGIAVIGDPRNDSHIFVNQLHVAFSRMHNLLVERLREDGVAEAELFDEARRATMWHYQWILVHEYLPTLIGAAFVGVQVYEYIKLVGHGFTPAGYREKGRFRIQQDSLPTWSHPVVAGGRLYLRDQDTIYAFDVREKK